MSVWLWCQLTFLLSCAYCSHVQLPLHCKIWVTIGHPGFPESRSQLWVSIIIVCVSKPTLLCLCQSKAWDSWLTCSANTLCGSRGLADYVGSKYFTLHWFSQHEFVRMDTWNWLSHGRAMIEQLEATDVSNVKPHCSQLVEASALQSDTLHKAI